MRALIVALGAALIAFILGRQRHDSSGGGASLPSPPAADTSEQATRHAETLRQQRRQADAAERQARAAWWTFVVAAVALLVATAGALLALSTYRVAQQEARAAISQASSAQDTLTAETRPWIEITGATATQLEMTPDQVLVSVVFSYKNIGSGPATSVEVIPRLLIPMIEPLAFLWTKRLCIEAVTRGQLGGNAILPGESATTTPYGFGRPMSDLQRGRDAALALIPGGDKAGSVALASVMSFEVIACIAYRFPGSADAHGTSFTGTLTRSREVVSDGVTSAFFDIRHPVVLQEGDLKLDPTPRGKYAD